MGFPCCSPFSPPLPRAPRPLCSYMSCGSGLGLTSSSV